jgi:hypothetical protein
MKSGTSPKLAADHIEKASFFEAPTNLGGYRTGITEQQLKGAPKYGSDNEWSWEDQTRTRAVNDYYGVIPV